MRNRLHILFCFFLIFFSEKIKAQSDSSGTIICTFPEVAQFPGGDKAWADFIKSNLHYPDSARKSGIQGMVFIQFTVDTNGKISDSKLMKGIAGHPEFETEAMRVLMLSPAWLPGKENGKKVKMKMVQPFHFVLPDMPEPCLCGKCISSDSLGEVLLFAEQMPEFTGGEIELFKFISQEIHPEANWKRAGGSVFIQFVVMEDGSLVNIRPVRSIDETDELTMAVVEAFCKMPKWKAAETGGKKCKCEVKQKIIIDVR